MRSLSLSSIVVATILAISIPFIHGFHSSPLTSLNRVRKATFQRAKVNNVETYGGLDFLSVLANIDKRNSTASYSRSPLSDAGTNDESRRMFLSSVLMSASVAIYPHYAEALPEPSAIPWTSSPINRVRGILLNQAESVYDLRFVTYLSRFLLSFDKECQKWWYRRGTVDIPSTSTAEQVKEIRLKHFAMFSASVEVGLQEFLDLKNDNIENMSNLGNSSGGPKVLMKSLVDRYGGGVGFAGSGPKSSDYLVNEKTMSDDERLRRKREVKEARRQIALLFGLMKSNQPTEMMTQLLAAIDDGKVDRIELINPGRGYAYGYGPPRVHFPAPEVYESGKIAKGRAILQPSSRLLRIDVDIKNRGKGYTKPPIVKVSPPNLSTFKGAESRAATAEATVFKSGENKGKIESIQLIDQGYGYTEDDQIQVTITPPSAPLIKVDSVSSDADTSKTCLAKAVLEYEVGKIEITDPGEGYAIEKPLDLVIDEPPPTAGLNMLDPLVVKKFRLNVDEFAGSQDMSKTLLDFRGKNSESAKARAFCVAETNSYKSFRKANDNQAVVFEKALLKQKIKAKGDENSITPMPFWTGGTSNTSPQLLSLLPSGIGLLYNKDLKRYDIVAGDDILDYDWKDSVSPGKPLNPMFGPRGRSPIEREKEVDFSTLLRFYLAGAICCSTVHLVLTPIDVVKTNMQTKPDLYPDPFTSFKKISEDSGVKGFFAGWAPTFIGFFINGGVIYTCIEFFRRFYTEIAGDLASSYEVPIILLSSVSDFVYLYVLLSIGFGPNIFTFTQSVHCCCHWRLHIDTFRSDSNS